MVMNFTKDTLWDLRQEIRLGSLFYNDYRNSFGVDEHDCCDFFDGFIEWYEDERFARDSLGQDVEFEDWFYDNPEDLWDYYCMYEEEPLPIQQDDDYYGESKNHSKEKVRESSVYSFDKSIEELIDGGYEDALNYLRTVYLYDVYDETVFYADESDVSNGELIDHFAGIYFVPEDFVSMAGDDWSKVQ